MARLWDLAESRLGRITQGKLAEEADVLPQMVSRWSTGEALPQNADLLYKVGRVLAGWAGEKPQSVVAWSIRLGFDQGQASAARTPEAGRVQFGRLIHEITDPQDLERILEIHSAIAPAELDDKSLPFLTEYVDRDHDEELAEIVSAAAAGHSGIAVLIGLSSTGKTRACWEAVKALPRGWRLWHPFAPSWQEALLAGLPDVPPDTVIWLNEIHRYLLLEQGESVAATLRELLADRGRGPVLVVGTAWLDRWNLLTRVPPLGEPDPHEQARRLLGRGIFVPKAFCGAEEIGRARRAASADPRWAIVMKRAEDAEFIQYLAGAPALMSLYTNARPEAKALLHAAMDARRFGIGRALPWPMLTAATEGYLTEKEIRLRKPDWPEVAQTYLVQELHGGTQAMGESVFLDGQPRPEYDCYQLADYLEQIGRVERAIEEPPASFWGAACLYASATDLRSTAAAAQARGLLRHAALMHRRAVDERGDLYAAVQLLSLVRAVDPASATAAAEWMTSRIVLASLTRDDDYPRTLLGFLNQLHECGATTAVNDLASTIAAAALPPGDRFIQTLLETFTTMGANDAISVLAGRIITPGSLTIWQPMSPLMIKVLSQAGAGDEARLLARHLARTFSSEQPESASTFSPDPPRPIQLLAQLRDLGLDDEAAELADELAKHYDWTNRGSTRVLAGLRENGFLEAAGQLAERAVLQENLSRPGLTAALLSELRKVGKEAVLLRLDPASQADVGYPAWVAQLASELGKAGAVESAIRLVVRVNPRNAPELLENVLDQDCVPQVVAAVAQVAMSGVDPSQPTHVRDLLNELSRANAGDLVHELASWSSWEVNVSDPSAAIKLIRALCEAGENNAAQSIAQRAAADASIASAAATAGLIRETRKLGLTAEASHLANRATETTLNWLPALINLLAAMNEADAKSARNALARKAAEGINPFLARTQDESALAQLLSVLHETGQDDVISGILRGLAHDASADTQAVRFALEHARRLGIEPVWTEIERDVLPSVSLADPGAAARLLRDLDRIGTTAAVHVANRASQEALVDRQGIAQLLKEIRESGAAAAVETLTKRIRDEGDPGLMELPELVEELRQVAANQAIEAIIARAMEVARSSSLLGRLDLLLTLAHLRYPRKAIEALAREVPLFAGFSNPSSQEIEQVHMALEEVPRAMLELGARDALAEFAGRAAGQGYFDRMRKHAPEWASKFPYGRAPKGHPEPPWGWML